MALGAFHQLYRADPLFQVGLGDLIRLVIVASVAGIFRITVRVANFTIEHTLIPVIQRETVPMEQGGRPGLGSVAQLTLHPEESGVDLRLSVALDACFGCAGKYLVLVAVLAWDFGVFPVQGKDFFVIEIVHAIHPVVTGGAVLPILTLVGTHEGRPLYALGVAIDTVLRSEIFGLPLVAVVATEGFALVGLLVVNQGKTALRQVIEGGTLVERRKPAARVMAVGTLVGEHVGVRVIIGVALCTIFGRALEQRHGQPKSRQAPSAGFLKRVAAAAMELGVKAGEGEGSRLVIKIHELVSPIVTNRAVFPVILAVLDDEGEVLGRVAFCARSLRYRKAVLLRMAGPAFHG